MLIFLHNIVIFLFLRFCLIYLCHELWINWWCFVCWKFWFFITALWEYPTSGYIQCIMKLFLNSHAPRRGYTIKKNASRWTYIYVLKYIIIWSLWSENRSWFSCTGSSCVYVPTITYPVNISHKGKKNVSNQSFRSRSFENIVTAGHSLRWPLIILTKFPKKTEETSKVTSLHIWCLGKY